MAGPTITRVRTIATSPGEGNIQRRLIVVKVETSEPASMASGALPSHRGTPPFMPVVDEFLAPLLVGRDPRRIEGHLADGPRQHLLA